MHVYIVLCVCMVDRQTGLWPLHISPCQKQSEVINLLLVFYRPNLKKTTLLTKLIIIKLTTMY